MAADGDYGVGFGSKAYTWSQFPTDFPAGTYSFKVETGNLKNQSASVDTTSPLVYPDRQPALSSASYSALTNLDVQNSVALNWGSWSAGPMGGYTFFAIDDLSTETNVISDEGPNATFTGITVQPNTFKIGHVYRFSIKFDAYDQGQPGFGGQLGAANTAAETTGTFGVGVAKVAIAPLLVLGGDDGVGTITLNAPATTALVIDLASSSGSASVPSSVTISKGFSSTTFQIGTKAVSSLTAVDITASINGAQTVGKFEVRPVGVESVTLSPSTVVGGDTVTCTINLEGAALSAVTVSFASSATGVVPTPMPLTIAAGHKSATFTLQTKAVLSAVVVSLGATANGIEKIARLDVKP
jgi:hypothetical protein